MSEFDEYRLRYEEEINSSIAFGGKSHDFYTKVKADVLVEILRRLAPVRSLDVLDIGCGNGALHPFLLSSGQPMTLTGIEVAAEFVAVARQANRDVTYDIYDGQRLPYDTGRFDAAFSVCVMHHVPPRHWPDFLAEMSRVVRPGGQVAVFEHNPFNPMTAHIVRTCPLDRSAVLLKPADLAKLMRGANLASVACEFILFTPFENPRVRYLERLIRWLPLGAQYVSFGQVPVAIAGGAAARLDE